MDKFVVARRALQDAPPPLSLTILLKRLMFFLNSSLEGRVSPQHITSTPVYLSTVTPKNSKILNQPKCCYSQKKRAVYETPHSGTVPCGQSSLSVHLTVQYDFLMATETSSDESHKEVGVLLTFGGTLLVWFQETAILIG